MNCLDYTILLLWTKRKNEDGRRDLRFLSLIKYLQTHKPIGSGRYQSALYHLSEDISEENNLATANPERLKAMSDLLEQWEEEVGKTGLPFDQIPRVKKKKN